jgi:hypothetical protein
MRLFPSALRWQLCAAPFGGADLLSTGAPEVTGRVLGRGL